ncbi:cdc42 effector protein 3 [Clupea harengus]|uniref:Cdc42 effector protein 3 n=1 Tax=Clupea harengus TaxID=7950 RepID=A0A6P3VHM4_CLUHA|nr:cdc42 effector protein 3 [Clupea harengus]
MPAKAPIYLKTNHTKRGKKFRLRDILRPDMISPPMGDFRHTIHIGKAGARDTFGDMSFLQGNFELLPGKGEVARHQQHGGQHSEFLRANSASDASFAETPSPVLKNAISLPTIGSGQALTLPLLSSAVFPVSSDPLDGPLEVLPIPPSGLDDVDDVVVDGNTLEILQIDSLLQSITIFGRQPSLPPADHQERPALTINLVETPEMPPPVKKKALPKISKVLSTENCSEKRQPPASFYNGNSHSNSIYNGNGNCNGSGNYNYNSSGNFKGFGLYNGNTILCEKEGNGGWADRDSGVEEGRMCDFDFELAKEKSISQESLSLITGSLLSLELDLGPSILDDILNIMDKPQPGIKA